MFDYSIKISIKDKISAELARINRKLKNTPRDFKVNTRKARASLRLLRRELDKTQKKIDKIRQLGKDKLSVGLAQAGMAYASAKPMLNALNTAREYQLAFKDVKKEVNGTDAELARLRQGLKDFKGASFEDLSAVTAEVGKMGFNAKEALPMVANVIKASKALDFDAGEAVAQTGKILAMTNQTKNAVKATAQIMDIATHLENKLAGVKAGGILNIWKRNSGLYSDLGLNNAQMGAMSGFLEQNFVNSELGATAFKIMINRFIAQSGKIQKALGKKINFYDILKTQGLAGFKDIMANIKTMDKATRLKIFGSEAMPLIRKLLDTKNIDKLTQSLKYAQNAQGAVNREWKLYRATYDERLNDFKKSAKNIQDTIGTLIIPTVTKLLNKLTSLLGKINKWAKENPKVASTILKIAGAIGIILASMATFNIAIGVSKIALGGFIGLFKVPKILTLGITGLQTVLAGLTNIKTATSLIPTSITIGVSLLGITAVIAGLNAIAKHSHQAITDKRKISPTLANKGKIEAKIKRINEKIKDMKGENGIFAKAKSLFLDGNSNKYKIRALEKQRDRASKSLNEIHIKVTSDKGTNATVTKTAGTAKLKLKNAGNGI